ncbi:2OG-Fe dioxygenase family protein [Bacillus sp. H1a]|uniref:2OG-Fe dioxygenase family protein n=1 Tax=Bacillus sp. H1a TaxID=1397276 RepID=UPI000469CFD4|nr:2OG-Fe dioxygenase family protein [Bacillus sp. H1a]
MKTIKNRPEAIKGNSSYSVADHSGLPINFTNTKQLWATNNEPGFTETNPLAYFPTQLSNMDNEIQSSFKELSSLFKNLPMDPYLQDGATFRYRRFGSFKLDSHNPFNEPEILPHRPFFQSSKINKYAGDIARNFAPLEQEMIENLYLKTFIKNLFNMIPTHERIKSPFWEVEVHPIRVIGSAEEEGHGAPEGVHTDGHSFASILLVNRENVSGADSIFADMDKVIFWQNPLLNSGDTVLWDDAHCLHDVTPITPTDITKLAIRDVISTSWNPLNK